MANKASARQKYARGPVTDRVQAKLVRMMKASEGSSFKMQNIILSQK